MPTASRPRRGAGLLTVALLLAAVVAAPAGAAPTDVFAGATLFVDPGSPAADEADRWRTSDPSRAALYDRIAERPQADWFGDWYGVGEVDDAVAARTRQIRAAGALPVYVLYAIPARDCGGYSAGGTDTPAGYRAWIDAVASGLDGGPAAVIVEPDALAQLSCLDAAEQQDRLALLEHAVDRLAAAGATPYLDAGHSGWVPVDEMADRLRQAGVADARGFALNVSNLRWTETEIAYARALSDRLDGAHAVVDTSRNGQGPAADGSWCNAPGRGLGPSPSATTADPVVDAYLWIKRPGESDGTCNGGPAAGVWWPAGAEELARLASERLGPDDPTEPGESDAPTEPSEPTSPTPVASMRLWGPDRVATAVAVSRSGWAASDTIVLARSDDPADALAGAALAGRHDAPLLITPPDRLAERVRDEVDRLGAERAVLLGGTAALAPRVAEQLRALGVDHVVRHAGPSRSGTAAAIADAVTDRADTALLVHERAWADALSASGLAARRARAANPWPVLLAGDTVPDATRRALDRLQVDEVVVIGGAASLSDDVVRALRATGRDVRRVAGATRHGTSTAVADLDRRLHGGGPALLATGAGFADGLAAGALAARLDGVMLLAPPDRADPGQLDWLRAHRRAITATVVVGGALALSEQVVAAMDAAGS
jgi:endoglucanase